MSSVHPDDIMSAINLDGDDGNVRNLNPFLIDPAGKAHHVCSMVSAGSHDPTKERNMTTKRLVLAASMMAFVAMSGQAYAGTTISDTRYWPSEVGPADPNSVQRAENAFDSNALYLAKMSRGIEATGPSYQGRPTGNY
jgi:hypothetical protein